MAFDTYASCSLRSCAIFAQRRKRYIETSRPFGQTLLSTRCRFSPVSSILSGIESRRLLPNSYECPLAACFPTASAFLSSAHLALRLPSASTCSRKTVFGQRGQSPGSTTIKLASSEPQWRCTCSPTGFICKHLPASLSSGLSADKPSTTNLFPRAFF
jgi:hypothetical protein